VDAPIRQATKIEPRDREMCQHPQIAGAVQQRDRLRLDLLPVWLLGRNDGIAELLFGLTLRGTFQRTEIGIELQIGAGRFVVGNRCDDRGDVERWHVSPVARTGCACTGAAATRSCPACRVQPAAPHHCCRLTRTHYEKRTFAYADRNVQDND
jgi:hypothetical protein